MKVWMNVWDTPTQGNHELPNGDLAVGGFYPGSGFYRSEEDARHAAAVAKSAVKYRSATLLVTTQINLPGDDE